MLLKASDTYKKEDVREAVDQAIWTAQDGEVPLLDDWSNNRNLRVRHDHTDDERLFLYWQVEDGENIPVFNIRMEEPSAYDAEAVDMVGRILTDIVWSELVKTDWEGVRVEDFIKAKRIR